MDERKTIRVFSDRDGMKYATAIKRRQQAMIGICVPPGTWLLTESEWNIVKTTPLAGCTGKR